MLLSQILPRKRSFFSFLCYIRCVLFFRFFVCLFVCLFCFVLFCFSFFLKVFQCVLSFTNITQSGQFKSSDDWYQAGWVILRLLLARKLTRKSKNSQIVFTLHPRNNPMLPPISPRERKRTMHLMVDHKVNNHLFILGTKVHWA